MRFTSMLLVLLMMLCSSACSRKSTPDALPAAATSPHPEATTTTAEQKSMRQIMEQYRSYMSKQIDNGRNVYCSFHPIQDNLWDGYYFENMTEHACAWGSIRYYPTILLSEETKTYSFSLSFEKEQLFDRITRIQINDMSINSAYIDKTSSPPMCTVEVYKSTADASKNALYDALSQALNTDHVTITFNDTISFSLTPEEIAETKQYMNMFNDLQAMMATLSPS